MVRLGVLVAFLMCVAGCGYTTQNLIPAGVESIYIPTFKNATFKISKTNRTFKRDIENNITDAVVREFTKDGSLKVVSKDQADWMLEGTVVDYRSEPLRYSHANADIVSEMRVRITVELNLVDLKTGKTLWDHKTVERKKNFYVDGSVLDEEDRSLIQTAELLGKDIYTEVAEGWY